MKYSIVPDKTYIPMGRMNRIFMENNSNASQYVLPREQVPLNNKHHLPITSKQYFWSSVRASPNLLHTLA